MQQYSQCLAYAQNAHEHMFDTNFLGEAIALIRERMNGEEEGEKNSSAFGIWFDPNSEIAFERINQLKSKQLLRSVLVLGLEIHNVLERERSFAL